jgi:hypothetical protein
LPPLPLLPIAPSARACATQSVVDKPELRGLIESNFSQRQALRATSVRPKCTSRRCQNCHMRRLSSRRRDGGARLQGRAREPPGGGIGARIEKSRDAVRVIKWRAKADLGPCRGRSTERRVRANWDGFVERSPRGQVTSGLSSPAGVGAGGGSGSSEAPPASLGKNASAQARP